MARYIEVDAYIKYCEEHWIPLNIDAIKKQSTADMVDIITNELTNKISERIIRALEENYEIIPKKPAVQCKDCKHREKNHYCLIWGQPYLCNDECFCSYGERRTDVKNEEVNIYKMIAHLEKLGLHKGATEDAEIH